MTDNEKTTGVPIDDDALDKVAGGMHVVTSERANHAANANPNGPMNISSRDPAGVEIQPTTPRSANLLTASTASNMKNGIIRLFNEHRKSDLQGGIIHDRQ